MQKRSELKTRGFAPIFHKQALQFVLDWHKPMRVNEDWIQMIEMCAAKPDVLRHSFAVDFALTYAAAPDLAAALLNFFRKKWAALEKSKAGKLKKFLSLYTVVKWRDSFGPANKVAIKKTNDYWRKRFPNGLVGAGAPTIEDAKFVKENAEKWKPGDRAACDSMGNCDIWHLQDGELAIAFERSPGGEVVTVEDVRKARQWVVAAVKDGKKFAEKVLDKDGFIHVKSTTRRRK